MVFLSIFFFLLIFYWSCFSGSDLFFNPPSLAAMISSSFFRFSCLVEEILLETLIFLLFFLLRTLSQISSWTSLFATCIVAHQGGRIAGFLRLIRGSQHYLSFRQSLLIIQNWRALFWSLQTFYLWIMVNIKKLQSCSYW